MSSWSWPQATETESGVGLRLISGARVSGWWWGLQIGFLCFPKPVENHYIFAFCRLWGKVLLKKFCEFFWLELHQYGEKGRLAITCISGHITNTTS